MTIPTTVEALHGHLIVSVQAYAGEPLRKPEIIAAMAQSVVLGGAQVLRIQGTDDIRAVSSQVCVPIIGLIKVDRPGVFITPTVNDVKAVLDAGADIVAVDGTPRARPAGQPLRELIAAAHDAGKPVMADCASEEDARYSINAGADLVGTTLAGYTSSRALTSGPDLDLVSILVALDACPVVAEGRIWSPEQAQECFDRGAFAVTVGSAITHPMRITQHWITQLGHD